jgi:hypothetical protein
MPLGRAAERSCGGRGAAESRPWGRSHRDDQGEPRRICETRMPAGACWQIPMENRNGETTADKEQRVNEKG